MKTVELSAALGQAQVVENLKNFVGVDAQGAAALMTPERLAAVAGGLATKTVANTNADDLKTQGTYHLTNGCTPEYVFIIVLNIGNYILQFKTTDGGSSLQTRSFNNKVWSPWSK